MIIARFPEGHPAHIPLQLAYRCGLRLGEAFALTWDDIDFVAGTININKQVQNINQHWQFKAPKYDSSRIITMDSKISDLLARTKAQQKKDAQFYGDLYTRYYSNSTRTINSDGDGYEIHLVMQHCFRIVHYQLDLPKVDYHSLRHTHATILIENDAPIKSVQARLGHRTVKETLDIYTHATKKMDAKVLNILDSI
jgi:integrase